MDGMDSFIFSLVLVPALRDVLPSSGIPATTANVGYYSGLLFALFMVGWGVALVWGPIADRFGRARTLMFSILWFSAFTLLAALCKNVWSLALVRFLAGVGIGGEWSIGASLVSEEWPEQRRTWGVCLMHTGYYIGFMIAAVANYFIGSQYGWRWMFVVGGAPAILVAFFYNRLHEPARWKNRREEGGIIAMHHAFFKLFTAQYRRANHPQLAVPGGIHRRVVGRLGLRAVGHHVSCGERPSVDAHRRAPRVLLDRHSRHRNDHRRLVDSRFLPSVWTGELSSGYFSA